MSKKITHEQAEIRLVVLDQRAKTLELNHLIGSRKIADMEVKDIANGLKKVAHTLREYINQQEKQEKLLELYKELIIELDLEFEEFERFGDKVKNPELDKLRIKNVNPLVFEGKAPKLFKQIKELEDDKN